MSSARQELHEKSIKELMKDNGRRPEHARQLEASCPFPSSADER
jgi:hypothetical protein